MKTKCPVCNSCLDIIWVGNRRFFNCFLCRTTYDIYKGELREVDKIYLENDPSTSQYREIVTAVTYKERN